MLHYINVALFDVALFDAALFTAELLNIVLLSNCTINAALYQCPTI